MTSHGAVKAHEGPIAADAAQHVRDAEAARLERAAFPFLKGVDDFDFSVQPGLRIEQLAPQLSPSFVAKGESLILTGKPGRGKTHLAVAIAQRAIAHGYEARFVSASRLVESIARHIARGRGRRAMLLYVQAPVLVLDDVGYVRHNPHAASILFQVVSERHRRGRSMILTANQPPEQWGELLGDPDAADAILDRLLERGTHLALGGPSMRAAHAAVEELRADVTHPVLRLAPPCSTLAPEDGEALCKRVAAQLVGRLGLKEAIYHLRGAMNFEALERSRGSRRAAANLLGVDRRYVQRLADEYEGGSASSDDTP